MKESTNLLFVVKISVLMGLLLVSYAKKRVVYKASVSEAKVTLKDNKFSENFFQPLTVSRKRSSLAPLQDKLFFAPKK